MKKTVAGYVFHVAIIGAPDIWRRIQIRSDWTLWELHEAIYSAYDRIDDHMFCFYVTKPGSRGRQAIRDAVETVWRVATNGIGETDFRTAIHVKELPGHVTVNAH